jgi:UDP-glucose 4-epimerase
MRVLVTGATAAFGAALVRALLGREDVELVLAVGREREHELPSHFKLEYRSVDLSRPRVLHDLIWGPVRRLSIDVVVHAIQHRRSADVGPAIHAQNVDATRELVLACGDHPTIRRLVYRSFAEVYALRHGTSDLLDEEGPLDFDPIAPQWVRDRVEADLTVCAHLAGKLPIAILRCAEIVAAGTGSQLWDYLQSKVCFRPLGFDPMLNVLSLPDAVAAFELALRSTAVGAFNIPGFDTLPLSCAIEESRRADVPVPGPLMTPLYGLRRVVAGFDFRYDMNLRRFHFGGVLDGTRAKEVLGYVPRTPVAWPKSWWNQLLEGLAERDRTTSVSR